MVHHDYQHRAVAAVIVIPAVVHSHRAPAIRATVKQVRYEPLVTVAIITKAKKAKKNIP